MRATQTSSEDRADARPSRGRHGWLVVALGGAGLPGLLAAPTGAPGVPDPLALYAWLVFLAPAAGILGGARGLRPWPAGAIVPAVWSFLLLQAALASPRELPAASWGMAIVAGLFFAGLGVGARWAESGWALAGYALLAMLLATGLGVCGGTGAEQAGWGRRHPRVARALLEVSPLVLAFESAGVDWTHAHPVVYARSGVEWVPRRPYRGILAGPVVLLVGSLTALLADRRPSGARS